MKWKIGNTTLEVLPPVKRYMNAIERQLQVDRKTRIRIMTELASDFQSRRESGQSDETIMKELGTPEEVASQFNTSLHAPHKPNRWRWAFVGLAVLILVIALLPMLVDKLAVDQAASLGIIGGADGPTAIYVSASTPQLLIGSLPWLLGCAAGFLLPTWRDPHAGKGYGASLLLCGLGLLPLCLVMMELVVVACTMELPLYQLGAACWALLLGFFTNGEWLCAAVAGWACIARSRARKISGKENKKI